MKGGGRLCCSVAFLPAWELATLFSPEGECKGGSSKENEKLACKRLGAELIFVYVGQLYHSNLFCLRCPCITPWEQITNNQGEQWVLCLWYLLLGKKKNPNNSKKALHPKGLEKNHSKCCTGLQLPSAPSCDLFSLPFGFGFPCALLCLPTLYYWESLGRVCKCWNVGI